MQHQPLRIEVERPVNFDLHGVNAAGRLALVTNVRGPGRQLMASPSRGELVLQCLTDAHADLAVLAQRPRNGFNLLTVDLAADPWERPDTAVGQWVSNRPAVQGRVIGPGAFGLSNAALDTPWPKVRTLKQRLIQAVDQHQELDALADGLFAALLDPLPASDADRDEINHVLIPAQPDGNARRVGHRQWIWRGMV